MNGVRWVGAVTLAVSVMGCLTRPAFAAQEAQLQSALVSSSSSRIPGAEYVAAGGPVGGADRTASGHAARAVVARPASQQVDLYGEAVRPFSKFSIGFETGTLGIGVQAATPLSRTLNLRAGADFLNFGNSFSLDAAQYESQAHLRTAHVSVDWHPLSGGFRVSPELLIFESGFSASVHVTGGRGFELGNTQYLSSAIDPVHGGASISMGRSVMPAFTIGFGNMLGDRRHWSIPVEIGVAYTGHYTLNLDLDGTACLNYVACMSTRSQQIQTSVHQEESNINETMKHFQVYPILSSGIAYRF